MVVSFPWLYRYLHTEQSRIRRKGRPEHSWCAYGSPVAWTYYRAETVDREIAIAERATCMLGILLIDLDNFKGVNDRFGHAAGDLHLVEVATRLRAALRQGDVLFRVGGDEFVAVLPGLESMPAVHTLLSRLITAVHRPVSVDSHIEPPTVTIGAAIYPQHGRSLSELQAVADRALYEAKSHGRNQYWLASP